MLMKKTLLSLSILFSVAASAQLTYDNHAPALGNLNYSTYQCDSVGIVPGAGGAGQTWNYAISGLNSQKNYTTAASANVAFNPADVQVSSGSNNTLYYKASANDLQYYGGNLTISSFNMSVKYAAPAIYAIYPMALNTTTTSMTSGTVQVTTPLPTTQAFTGTCTALADGTGTLVLPAKTFTNVIRVVTSQTLIAGSVATVKLQNYDYYSIGSAAKAPVLSIQASTVTSGFGTSTQTIVVVEKDYELVGINEVKAAKIDLSVFPNPASTFINFSTNSPDAVKVVAMDVTGKVVATETIEMGKAKMNTGNLSTGVYLYSVLGKDNETLKTGKFNITK